MLRFLCIAVLSLSCFLFSLTSHAQEKTNLEAFRQGLQTPAAEKTHDISFLGGQFASQGFAVVHIPFASNKADIPSESLPVIDELAGLLKKHTDWTLRIEGHTDNFGEPGYNKALSLRRAESIATALIAKGIDSQRLISLGLGQEYPLAANTTREGRAANRRVELHKQ